MEVIRPTSAEIDAMTQETVDQILRHNRLFEQHCE